MKMSLLFSAILLAGCASASPGVIPAAACPVASSDWNAWVNAMPGPGSSPKLIITGQVTAPTGGYSFGWSDFRVAESYPVQVFVNLTATPPAGPATQAARAAIRRLSGRSPSCAAARRWRGFPLWKMPPSC
jgi:hypothetical protein